MSPDDRKYSREHEWIRLEGETRGYVGITEFAQESLGDVVYLDLPPVGTHLEQSAKMGEVESVKAVSDIYSPISGEVVEINGDLVDHPEVVNEDPYGQGWLLQVEVHNSSELENLLTAEQYESFLSESAA